MRPPIRLVLCLALVLGCASGARAEGAVHLGDGSHVGIGLQGLRARGRLFGSTVGVGTMDPDDSALATLEASAGFGALSLDLQLARVQVTSLARGAFSFDGAFFPLGADVTAALTWLDVVGRWRLLDRPTVRLSLLGGARLLRSEVEARTRTVDARSGEFQALPVAGAVLEARLYPRSVLFGQFRYFDVSSEAESSYNLGGEAGLSYLLGSEPDDTAGWRLTGGYRFMELEVQERLDQVNRVAFALEMQGPYVHVSWNY